MRRHIKLTIILLFLAKLFVIAQDIKPFILHSPIDWRFERIDFPLDFAPEIKYEGFEELRFAPGMFDTLSDTYFTYVFVVSINKQVEIEKDELSTFLLSYYKGLCIEVAKSKNLNVNASKIKLTIRKADRIKGNIQSYMAQINFFDVFNNGEEVLLNLNLEIISNKQENKVRIFALVSPKDMESIVWTALFDIREKTKLYY